MPSGERHQISAYVALRAGDVEQLALAGWSEITCMHRVGSNTRVLLQLQARFGADRRLEPVPGSDLTLTLDMELMRAIDRSFTRLGHRSGAAAVVNARIRREWAS